jgi:polysaccharide biosynthesis/export protein
VLASDGLALKCEYVPWQSGAQIMSLISIRQQRFLRVIIRLASALLAIGCAAYSAPSDNRAQSNALLARGQLSPDRGTPATMIAETGDGGGAIDTLWKTRMEGDSTDASPRTFTLGPGDLLRISVPLIAQLKDRTVRVSEDGTIALPLVGVISVTGMTEQDLRDVLIHRVAKYMYHPQVEVFLQHTENRQVAVLGSVKKPGRYMLASHTDSIMTMISRAGGLNDDASTRIMLFPSPLGPTHEVHSLSEETQPGGISNYSRAPILLAKNEVASATVDDASESTSMHTDLNKSLTGEQFVIDISRPDNQRYLDMSARPGDVIVVPAAGEVTVQGWVDKPGAFKVTPGLTVLGSIAAAGGPNFTSSATLLRERSDGGKLSVPLDVSKIKHGQAEDLRVQGGDVIIVEKSVAGAVPYALYFLVNKIGIAVPY